MHSVAVFIILSNYHLQCSLHQKSLSLKHAANCACALFSCTQSLLYIPKVNCYSLGDHTFAHVMELTAVIDEN